MRSQVPIGREVKRNNKRYIFSEQQRGGRMWTEDFTEET